MLASSPYEQSPRRVAAFALLLVALGLGLAGGLLGPYSLALIAPLFIALCVVWPVVGATALVIACALNRFTFSAGANLRLDELVALALAGALVVRAVFPIPPGRGKTEILGERSKAPLPGTPSPYLPVPASGEERGRAGDRLPTPSLLVREVGRPLPATVGRLFIFFPLAAYWGANVLSTVVSTSDRARGLNLDLLTLDLIVLFLALVSYVKTPDQLMTMVKLWLGVATVEALVGMAAFVHYLSVHGAVPGVQLDPISRAPLVYGTLSEGNIFGSYMSASFLIALAMLAGGVTRRRAPLYVACVATALGLLLSNTRSAWGATVVGAVVLLVLLNMGRKGQVERSRRTRLTARFLGGVVAIAIVLGIGLAVAPPSISGSFGARAQSLLNFGSGSGYGRVQLYKVALDEWRVHPILGAGPGSFSYRLPGDTSTGPAWLPNLTLQALHDTGIVGLLAMVWFFAAFYVVTLGALRRAPPGEGRAALAGLIAAMTALLVAFQLTPGFVLGYPWALLALGIAAARTTAAQGNYSAGVAVVSGS